MYSSLFFSMLITRSSRSRVGGLEWPGITDVEIREMITTQVTVVVREAIPFMFLSFATMMIELFDDRYASFMEVATSATNTVVSFVGL